VILRSMAKERDERFSSVNEMITAFKQALKEGESEVEQDQEAAAEVGLPALMKENIASIHQASLDQEGEVEGDKELHLPTSLITANGISFPLIGERLLIGREDPNHGFSPDIDLTEAEPVDKKTGKHRRTVHREQAWIYQTDKGWWVEVIPGKEKRAWFEGEPMEPGRSYLLHAGDKLKFGAVDLVVEH
ncbi:MAG: FHA domain-containing protein, partial [Anaerolineales bacterium]|nr:FHA domain-containing protein [Anaerolineales bacterium]